MGILTNKIEAQTVLGTSNDYCISTVVEMDETTETTRMNLMA
jgi:hypothetical protein